MFRTMLLGSAGATADMTIEEVTKHVAVLEAQEAERRKSRVSQWSGNLIAAPKSALGGGDGGA